MNRKRKTLYCNTNLFLFNTVWIHPVCRVSVPQAGLEVQAINMEKKKLMEHWNSSLAGMKQRDEAYVVTQELLRYGLKPGPEDTSGLGRGDSGRGFQWGLVSCGVQPVWAGCVRQNKFPALKYTINLKDEKHFLCCCFLYPNHISLLECGGLWKLL